MLSVAPHKTDRLRASKSISFWHIVRANTRTQSHMHIGNAAEAASKGPTPRTRHKLMENRMQRTGRYAAERASTTIHLDFFSVMLLLRRSVVVAGWYIFIQGFELHVALTKIE